MGKIAFLFPGQGSQSVGMGRELHDADPAIAALFAEANATLGFDLTDLMFNGPDETLRLTENAQPALVLTGLAVHHLVTEKTRLRADYVAGHSLGEYAAIAAAGGFSAMDAVRLVRKRGEAMRSALPAGVGGMAAVLNMAPADVEKICQQAAAETDLFCAPANYNTATQLVISGHVAAVQRAVELVKATKAKALPVPVSAAFHTPLMAKAAATMADVLAEQPIRDLAIPLIANVTADALTQGNEVKENLIEQITDPVRWEASMLRLLALGVDTFVELGSGQVLAGMMKRIHKEARILTINTPTDLEKLTDWI
ncbi:MAG: ACP S-malonyltransferase [Magnetococcales bacterium]|nr:ACP S-malonyltransferase [Magnetococcales bacterium]